MPPRTSRCRCLRAGCGLLERRGRCAARRGVRERPAGRQRAAQDWHDASQPPTEPGHATAKRRARAVSRGTTAPPWLPEGQSRCSSVVDPHCTFEASLIEQPSCTSCHAAVAMCPSATCCAAGLTVALGHVTWAAVPMRTLAGHWLYACNWLREHCGRLATLGDALVRPAERQCAVRYRCGASWSPTEPS